MDAAELNNEQDFPIMKTLFIAPIESFSCSESNQTTIASVSSKNFSSVDAKKQKKLRCLCDVCKKYFPSKGHLKIHMRTHTGEKPYVCYLCGKDSARLHDLKTHILTHSEKKLFRCNVCFSQFNTKSNYTRHLKLHIHSGNRRMKSKKDHICKICQELFPSKIELLNHHCSHFGKKPFTCDECNKGFTRQYDLKVHLRIHTGEKPYSCKICQVDFRQQCNYRRHLRIHEGS